jgi:hypothetical protein
VGISISEGESTLKHVGIIEFSGEQNKPLTLESAIPIVSQRPMIYSRLSYKDLLEFAEKDLKLTKEEKIKK